jgi:hypothetical protein
MLLWYTRCYSASARYHTRTNRGSPMTTKRASTTTSRVREPVAIGDSYGDGDGDSGEGQHPLAEAGQRTGEGVGRIAERATELGYRQADRGREQTAEGLDHLAGSIRRVSIDMEGERPAIANLATTAADQTEQFARYLHETDARQLIATVEDAARRQPLLFLGGAFLLGVAASRFLKAASGSTEVV